MITVESNWASLTPIPKACKDLNESSFYAVEIQLYESNVPHFGVLYTGFKTGAYRSLTTGTYHYTSSLQDITNHRIRVIALIPEISGPACARL